MATLPTDAQELFDHLVPEGLSKHPDKARELNAIYCFRSLAKVAASGRSTSPAHPPTCTKGDAGKAQCTVEVSNDDFKTMLGDPNAGMQLYFQGKLRVSGDPMLGDEAPAAVRDRPSHVRAGRRVTVFLHWRMRCKACASSTCHGSCRARSSR